MITRMRILLNVVLILSLALPFVACGSPEEKRARFFDKGEALFEKEDYVKAKLEFKNALQIDPKFADAYYMLGQVEMQESNFKQAFGLFRKAVELDPEMVSAHAAIGKLLFAAKQKDRAREKLDVVLSKDPNHWEGRMLQAAFWVSEGKASDAVPLLRKLIQEKPAKPDPYFMLTRIHLENEDLDAAIQELRDLLEEDGEIASARGRLAAILERKEDLDGAEKEYRTLIDQDPEDVQRHLALVRFLERHDRSEEAEKTIQKLVTSQPDQADLRVAQAQYYMEKEKRNEARKVLEKAIQDLPEAYAPVSLLASHHLSLEENDRAVALLDAFMGRVQTGPGFLQAKLMKARIRFQEEVVDEALALVDEVLKENAGDVGAHNLKGDILMVKRDFAGAVAEYRAVVHEQPDNLTAAVKLGRAHLFNGEPGLAEDTFKSVLEQNEKVREAHTGLMAIYRRQGDREKLKAQLESVLAVAPKDGPALSALGDLAMAEQKPEEAKAYYDRLAEATPDSPLPYFKQGNLALALQKPDEAMTFFETALEKNPDYTQALNRIVAVLVRQEKPEEALKRTREQVEKRPENPDYHLALGRILAVNQQPDEARRSFEKALELAPESQAPVFHLARLEEKLGRLDEAIERYEEIWEARPGNQAMGIILATLYDRQGKREKSMEVYKEVLEVHPDSMAAANNLAFYYAEDRPDEKHLKEALRLIEKPLQAQPETPNIVDTAAWIHYRMGDYEKAKNLMLTIADKIEDSGVLHYHLGMIYLKLAEEVKAAEHLNAAVKSAQDFPGKKEAQTVLKDLKRTG